MTTTVKKEPKQFPPKTPVSKLNTGRIAAGMGAIAGLLAALAPIVANLDTTSTLGVVGGAAVIVTAIVKWLDGWQKYEQDVRDPTKFNEPPA